MKPVTYIKVNCQPREEDDCAILHQMEQEWLQAHDMELREEFAKYISNMNGLDRAILRLERKSKRQDDPNLYVSPQGWTVQMRVSL